jgi:hypothetical protein
MANRKNRNTRRANRKNNVAMGGKRRRAATRKGTRKGARRH